MKESNNQTGDSLKNQVSSLYDLMKSESLDELEIKENDFYLYIKRKTAQDVMQIPVQMQQVPVYSQTPVKAQAAPDAGNSVEAIPCGLTVKSPIIGIYYQSPSPTSPTFVKEGETAPAGKTLCIVEAMKVMNEIKAEYPMKIIKILVENGKTVTANQDIFIVERV